MAVTLKLENGKTVVPIRQNQWTLYQSGEHVDVIAINDDQSDEWSLLRIKSDGTFHRHEFVGADSGFKVNKSNGVLVESKEEF